jgi:hypothetical protein
MIGVAAVAGKALVGQQRPDFTLKIDFVLADGGAGSGEYEQPGEASASGHERGLFEKIREMAIATEARYFSVTCKL